MSNETKQALEVLKHVHKAFIDGKFGPTGTFILSDRTGSIMEHVNTMNRIQAAIIALEKAEK